MMQIWATKTEGLNSPVVISVAMVGPNCHLHYFLSIYNHLKQLHFSSLLTERERESWPPVSALPGWPHRQVQSDENHSSGSDQTFIQKRFKIQMLLTTGLGALSYVFMA